MFLSQHASPSFDLSVFDFFGAAMASARLALVPASTFGRVASLCRFIVATGVTVWYSVPSALLRASGAESLELLQGSALRQIIFAGEEIPLGPLRDLWHNRRGPVGSRTGMARRRRTSARSTT